MMDTQYFENQIRQWLAPIRLSSLQLELRLPVRIDFQIPTLRGVWGSALRRLDSMVYHTVFEGTGPANMMVPQYIIRQSRVNEPFQIKDEYLYAYIDFLTWGIDSEQRFLTLRAWDIASGMGLGKTRKPFTVLKILNNFCDCYQKGEYEAIDESIPLTALLPEETEESELPCEVKFEIPLRLIRGKHFVNKPDPCTLADAILSRLAIIRCQCANEWHGTDKVVRPADIRPAFFQEFLEYVETIPYVPWQGERYTMRRYSGRQNSDIDLDGMVGSLQFPQGTKALWLLLKLAEQLHLGKTTTLGLGRPCLRFDDLES